MSPQERTSLAVTHPPVSTSGRLVVLSADDPRCAVRLVLDRVADKWTALVVTILADGPMGYADMRRSTAGISDKMLAQTLHRLERDGLVSREVRTAKPIRVTYTLTPLGETLVPPLAALRAWAVQYGPQVAAHQAGYDEGQASDGSS